jgi:hypothetical protein
MQPHHNNLNCGLWAEPALNLFMRDEKQNATQSRFYTSSSDATVPKVDGSNAACGQ